MAWLVTFKNPHHGDFQRYAAILLRPRSGLGVNVCDVQTSEDLPLEVLMYRPD